MAESVVWALVLVAGVPFGSAVPNRIVGGQEASVENYPSIVQVENFSIYAWWQICGASILTSRYVLSAAHCFDAGYDRRFRRIRAGSSYRSTGGVVAYVLRENNHPNYGLRGKDSDISVVELTTSLVYTPVVQQATIIAQGATIPYGTPVVYAGWGATSQAGGLSPSVLHDVNVYTINTQLCAERYLTLPDPGLVTENMICAGVLDVGGRDACQRDAGGPLYYDNIVIGVISWGHGCANETFPGVNTAVASFTSWIVATVV